MGTRPAIFKWRQTEPGLILCAVRWYLRYSLSLRDVEELLEERGLNVDHTTVWRWVRYYGPELEQRLRQHLKPTNKSWRVDETYVRVKGRWCYLYRAIDSRGATIDFLLSALRDADAAKRLFRKALGDRSHPQPRVINTDLAPIYSSAIPDSKKEGTLRTRCRYLLHDRDSKYCSSFRQVIEAGSVKTLALPPRSPNLNAYAERWGRSVKEECLAKLILLGEGSLRNALRHYEAHYHEERNHQGKDNILLFPLPTQAVGGEQEKLRCRERRGGLLKYYEREAA